MRTGADTRRSRYEDEDGEEWEPAREPRRRRHPVLATLSWLILAALTVPLAIRAAGADGVTPVPQLLAFLPWFLAPTWLALLGAALARRPLLLVWGLAVLVATGWFLQPYGSSAPGGAEERPAKARFRVLTSNLQYGGALPDLLDAVRRERPQVVSVQECDPTCAAALRTPELREAYPHRVIVDGARAEGSALLSRYPLSEKSVVPSRLAMPGAVATIGGERVRLQVAHPMPPDFGEVPLWRTELGRLRSYAAAGGDRPTLIAGDFNASADHATFRALLDTGLHDAARQLGHSRTPTWPTRTAPPLGVQIDHVLVSDRLVPMGAEFLDFAGTDHRALLVDLELF